MSEAHKSSTTAPWVVTAVAVPALYVLSVGPVIGLKVKGTIPDTMYAPLKSFYAPLEWFVEHTRTQPLIQKYGEWWIEALKAP